MCQYCERRKDVKFGWDQPKLPYHNQTDITSNLSGNALENDNWEGVIHDYQTASPVLQLICDGYFGGTGAGTIIIPIKYCPECGRKLGKNSDRLSKQICDDVNDAVGKLKQLYDNTDSIYKSKETDELFVQVCKLLGQYRDSHEDEVSNHFSISDYVDWLDAQIHDCTIKLDNIENKLKGCTVIESFSVGVEKVCMQSTLVTLRMIRDDMTNRMEMKSKEDTK